jgi:sulfur-oxidizing protein SoxY
MAMDLGQPKELTRRAVLKTAGNVTAVGLALAVMGTAMVGPASAVLPGTPGALQPEETIEETIVRLFGDREIQDGSAMMNLDLPVIAENGSVVPTMIETTLPMEADNHVSGIYILVDKNRRPMSAHYTFTPEAGEALLATRIRLGETTAVRAVAEMSDGSLYQVAKDVRVTIGGCGG